MMQVVLSIQAGRVIPPMMLLRKLGTYNQKSSLYRAFRELGRVERSCSCYGTSPDICRGIRAETTKIEAFANVADMTRVLSAIASDGRPVTPSLVACLSPYIREHIRRFGQCALNMDDLPGPLGRSSSR